MIDLACSAALVVVLLVAAAAYARRLAIVGPARHARVAQAGSSLLLGRGVLEMGYWTMRPAARACIALGIGPNAVSWASLGFAAGAAVALADGAFGLGAALSAVSAICDGLDGMIARETGTASDSGEILDATIDRYTELLFLGGIAINVRHSAPLLMLTLMATAGAIMVSYATAKGEAMGVTVPRGIMRRQERAVYLVLGVALVPVTVALRRALPGLPAWTEQSSLIVALALVGGLGNLSAVARLRAMVRAVARPAASRARTNPRGDVHAAARHAHVR